MSGWLIENLIAPWQEGFFQKAMLGGCLVAIASSVIGCLVILRRMAFLGDAISHAMLTGVAGGYLTMRLLFGTGAQAPAMLAGSVIAALITVMLIGFVSRATRIKEDTAIGIAYTGIFALGGVMISLFADKIHVDLLHFVMGHVLAVSDSDLWIAVIVTAGVLSMVILLFRHFQLTTFDPVMAASIGIPVVLLDYMLTGAVSLVVVSGVGMVGIILVVGLLITPAATAHLLCDRLGSMMIVAAVFGVTSIVGGLYASLWMNVAGGSAIILICTAQFLIVFTLAPRHGLLAWIRRLRLVPRQLVEDILRAMLLSDAPTMRISDVRPAIERHRARVSKAVRGMVRDGLLTERDGAIALTDAGREEATRVHRAHRLWESYLQHVGTPMDDLHAAANRLEHVHDKAALDYLDDKLGHPVTDPHGSTIPTDLTITAPGSVVTASLLRDGDEGMVVSAPPDLADSGLIEGAEVRVGRRIDDERTWTLVLHDGLVLKLTHEQADSVMVRLTTLASSR